MSLLKKIGNGIASLFMRAGLSVVKFFAAILLVIFKGVRFILLELWNILKMIGRAFALIFRTVTEPFRSRVKTSNQLTRDIRKAKKAGGWKYISAIIKFIGSFLFGDDGVAYTAFNYLLPILSVAFLVGMIRIGSSLEYGIAVEYNGREIGIISAEADFDEAEHDVQQRISYSENEEHIDLSAQFSLRIVSDEDKYVSAGQLADEMLAASDEELTEAYGIYIDGNFIGAVDDRDAVQDALMDNLLNYPVDGVIHDLSYVNKIEYTKGIYLANSVMNKNDTIKLLTSTKEKKALCVAQPGDSEASICNKYGMTLEKFYEVNPSAKEGFIPGQILNVIEKESYLPVQYVKEMETLSFLDYETIEVETSALNVGIESILVKGERGEKTSNIEITYVDGIERSRRVISSKITKEPIVEQIGIGTYSAQPDSPLSVYFGGPLTGSGEFGWPVDGGWISDTFISDRNHKGLDIAAGSGTEIYAAGDGIVVSAGWNSGGYGNVVMIDHLDGYQTVYGHMSYVVAVEGMYVTKGQLIGLVGSTGNSTGPHCHFEVRYEGVCYDPASFLNTMDAGLPKKSKDEEKDKDKD